MNAPSSTRTETLDRKNRLLVSYREVRQRTVSLCQPLEIEDFVVQPCVDVSPPKWHLGHTTWFFENFILAKDDSYNLYNDQFNFVFNSYYESEGARVLRTDRGNLSRPTVAEVAAYRIYVNEGMERLLAEEVSDEVMGFQAKLRWLSSSSFGSTRSAADAKYCAAIWRWVCVMMGKV